jgi:hypothetical protein
VLRGAQCLQYLFGIHEVTGPEIFFRSDQFAVKGSAVRRIKTTRHRQVPRPFEAPDQIPSQSQEGLFGCFKGGEEIPFK